jgi:hypothetical protein
MAVDLRNGLMRGCNDYTLRHADGPKRINVVFLVVMYGMCGTPMPLLCISNS